MKAEKIVQKLKFILNQRQAGDASEDEEDAAFKFAWICYNSS